MEKHARPKRRFVVYVCPTYLYDRCDELIAQENRGVFGCHPHDCADCTRTFDGWEFWGENGHLQGHARTREQMVAMVAYRAKKEGLGLRSGNSMSYYRS